MDESMLAEARDTDKYIITEKEITYRDVKRYEAPDKVYILDSPQTVMDFMSDLFDEKPIEALYAIALDSANEFLGFVKLAQGTVNRSAVYPRALVSFLLVETNATAVVLAHNHPGGSAMPSRSDVELTERAQKALRDLDVQLLDHLIYVPARVGREAQWVSLRERGEIAI